MSNLPPYSEYPRPEGSANAPVPGVSLEAVGEAWRLVRKDLGHWTSATLVFFVIVYAIWRPITMLADGVGSVPFNDPQAFERALGAVFLWIGLSVVPLCVANVMFVGMVAMGVRKSRGEYINVGMTFEPFRRFGTVFLASLLYLAVGFASFVLCFLPALFFVPVLMLMPTVAYLGNLGPLDALAATFDACKAHWAGLLALGIVLAGLSLLGACACGIGLLFAWPVYAVTLALHYRAFFEPNPPEPEPDVWR